MDIIAMYTCMFNLINFYTQKFASSKKDNSIIFSILPRVVFLDSHPTVSFFRYTEVVEDIPTLLTRTAMVIDPRLVSLKDKLAAMRVVC